jgi:hypothetical protein
MNSANFNKPVPCKGTTDCITQKGTDDYISGTVSEDEYEGL